MPGSDHETALPPPQPDAAFERDSLASLPDVARFARSLTRDVADADDLVQETYLRAYRGWHTFRPGHSMRAWLFTICRNVFLRQRERDRHLVDTSGEDAELDALAAVHGHAAAARDGYADLGALIDLGPAIDRAIAALPPHFRVAVVLVDVEGMPYDEAAAIAEVPVGTIRSRLFRGRRLLQEALLAHARDAGLRPSPPDSPSPTGATHER